MVNSQISQASCDDGKLCSVYVYTAEMVVYNFIILIFQEERHRGRKYWNQYVTFFGGDVGVRGIDTRRLSKKEKREKIKQRTEKKNEME